MWYEENDRTKLLLHLGHDFFSRFRQRNLTFMTFQHSKVGIEFIKIGKNGRNASAGKLNVSIVSPEFSSFSRRLFLLLNAKVRLFLLHLRSF